VGFVTAAGGPTSHTAVLARSRGIPAVVGCPGAADLLDGMPVLVDPVNNRVIANPADSDRMNQPVASSAHGPGRTADGHLVALQANIGGPADVPAALAAGAEGVGLYRTEFLFLDAHSAPDEAAQVSAYRDVFAAFPAGRVVVRVLDAGADKPLRFLS